MKKLLLLTGLLTSLFISCSKEEKTVVNDSIGNLENLEVHAVIGDNAVTKTAVQSNGTIYWTQGDAINLFYGNRTSAKFTTSINSPSASASFQGSITAVTGTNGNGNGAQSFWGVYPYNSLNTCDGTGVTLTIPSEQSGVAGTFASNLNPTVATSPNLDLAFYNVGSWFVFSVTRNDIVSVTFQGNASETLVGKVRVEMDGNSHPVVTQVTNGVTSITMTPDGGGCFTSGKDYYMVLIPQTLSNGYSVTLNTSDGSFATCVVDGSREFPRSEARVKHDVDDGLNFNIEFRDNLVKSICVANWDTNGDGELSGGEAAAVTSIPYGTFSGKTIQYFDEFQYFTGLTSSSSLVHKEERDEGEYDYYGTFYNCNRLKSITLPSTLTTIGIACFRECTALTDITIPSSVTTIKAIAFLGCPQLNVHMISESPCTLTQDPRGTWADPYVFGFLYQLVNAIYVPANAVATYKSAQYWPSSRIQAEN